MRKLTPSKSRALWKDSAIFAFLIFGGIETVMSVLAITLNCVDKISVRIVLVALGYIVLIAIVLLVKLYCSQKEVELSIRGIKVVIKEGDLFESNGWKLIPFNEYFDMKVDDIVIAKSSLNGKYIESLSDDNKDALKLAVSSDGTRTRHSLGTIKIFQDVMMLALTHFNDQNEAHTTRAEYEHTLRVMWGEISRVYAGRAINIPLIGGGITRLDDMTEKPNEQLLRCILCTLRTSTVTFTEPITIILTKSVLETINLYELKGVQ